jgi:hypothetical protein
VTALDERSATLSDAAAAVRLSEPHAPNLV